MTKKTNGVFSRALSKNCEALLKLVYVLYIYILYIYNLNRIK